METIKEAKIFLRENIEKGNLSIPKYVRLFNDKLYRFEGKNIDISNCIGSKFSYTELMGNIPTTPSLF